ncbi:glycosyltransferase family 9 protein [Streptomyces sp. TRM70308]|uniref:glycosyltransferase family 9 protein n=1 Tax=Streptomyces sp. TRM70308 TaxID=3131932 RepID=UPI003D026FCC
MSAAPDERPDRPPRAAGGADAGRGAARGAPVRPRIVALRALGLGDLLAAVPALKALRRAHPGHELVLAAPAGLRELALATGAVDRLLPASAPGRAVPARLDWTGPPPELAVDLHGTGPESADLLRPLRPARLLAFADAAGPPVVAQEHERERWCRLLRWYGVPADAADVRLPPPAAPSPLPGAVLVHPGAASGSRRWPAERFAAVAAALAAAGHRVAVTAGPDERPLAARVAALAGLPPDAVCAAPPLPVLSALVAHAAAVVSGDTGLAHLAVAHGTPSVTLFGPVPPSAWGPPPLPRHRALWHAGPPGDPHGRHPDPRLLAVQVPEVLAALGAPHVLPHDPLEVRCPAAPGPQAHRPPAPPSPPPPAHGPTAPRATRHRARPSASSSPPATAPTGSPGR